MKRAIKLLVMTLILTLCIPAALAEWKVVTDDTTYGKNDLAKFLGLQIKISDVDAEMQTATLMLFNGNADFKEKITLNVGSTYEFEDTHKIKLNEITDDLHNPVVLTVSQLVEIEVEQHIAPEVMEIGKSYQLEVHVINKGIEAEKLTIEIIPDEPYLRSDMERSSRAEPMITSKLTATIEPLEGIASGAATVNVVWEREEGSEILETFRLEDFQIKDLSSGYITDIVFPPKVMVGDSYFNKARIAITNDADVTSKFRIKFKSEGIHFNTGSKFGDDVLAEQLDPHTTKEQLYIPEFTPVTDGEQDVTIELYANGRIVDKEVITVTAESYYGTAGGSESDLEVEEAEVEEAPVAVAEVEEETLDAEVEEVEEVKESAPKPTGNVVSETEEEQDNNEDASWVALLAPFLLLAIVGKYFFLDKKEKKE